MTLEFREKLPERVPDSLVVYRLAEPPEYPDSAKQLSELASRMGMTGKASETCLSDDWTAHSEGLFHLSIHMQSGGITGRHRERYQQPVTESFDLDDEKATDIARGFLERSGLVELGDGSVRRVTHLRMAGGSSKGDERSEATLDAGVVFGRSIEGVAVDGPGGFAMINVDGEGEISGFTSVWRPIAEKAEEARILDAARANDAMERIAKQVSGDVTVTKATFAYFEQGIGDRQRFLQPAYIMVYVVQDGEVAYKSAEVVAATERTLEPFQGEKRFPAGRQPRRPEQRERASG
jgi:hypothetical protein